MIEQKYSITRTRATWKPRVTESDLPFYRCADCGAVYQGISQCDRTVLTGTGRTLVAELPYSRSMQQATSCCCGATMERMPFVELEDLPEGMELDYRLLGGFNSNAVECSWRFSDEGFALAWVALKTFTGSQLKYVLPKKRSPLLFALADEDAYVYCDESPCLECTFMCKRGFVLYAGVEDRHNSTQKDGCAESDESPLTSFVVKFPLTRMSPYWESRS